MDDEGRRALQAAVEEVRAALARLELPRRVTLDAVGEAIKAVRDAMRQQYAGTDLTPAAREEIRQAGEAERLSRHGSATWPSAQPTDHTRHARRPARRGAPL